MATEPCKSNVNYFTKYQQELKSRLLNLPCIVLVFYSVVIGASVEVSYNILLILNTEPELESCWFPPAKIPSTVSYVIPVVNAGLLAILYLIVGWIVDRNIGRRKGISLSLWSSWFGTLLHLISLCIQYSICGSVANIAKYGLSSFAFLFLLVGNVTFYVSFLAYGLDQLIDEPTSRVRAYIHWIVWGLFVGFLFGYIGFVQVSAYNLDLVLFTVLVIFVLISFAICIQVLSLPVFYPSYIAVNNPYFTVLAVLKYAYHYTYPAVRSALTYWETKVPDRIDLAKSKYGGPFSDNEVEDVKVFLRIFAIFLSLSGYFIPLFVILGISGINDFSGSDSVGGYGSYLLWNLFDKMIIVLVPVLELVIIPLFPKVEYFLLNPLRWFIVSYVFLFISLILMLALDITGSQISQNFCGTYNLSFLFYSIPLLFYGLTDTITFIYGFEFICSQAPVNMSGVLTGIIWLLRTIYTLIARLIKLLFLVIGRKVSCNFWLLLLQIVICFVGGLVFLKVVKWYQHRVRNDEYYPVPEIEKKFNRRFEYRNQLKNNRQKFNVINENNADSIQL